MPARVASVMAACTWMLSELYSGWLGSMPFVTSTTIRRACAFLDGQLRARALKEAYGLERLASAGPDIRASSCAPPGSVFRNEVPAVRYSSLSVGEAMAPAATGISM